MALSEVEPTFQQRLVKPVRLWVGVAAVRRRSFKCEWAGSVEVLLADGSGLRLEL